MATIPGYVKGVRRKTPIRDRRSAEAARLSPVAALVRRHDRDRYQTALFAPAARREALFALYAFNYEIARVRENIAAAFEGGVARRQPVVERLSAVIRELRLTREHFDRLIDAREIDLEDEPPASLVALENYAEASSSRLVYLALEALGVRDPAAGQAGHHIGIAYALAGLLRAMPIRAHRIIPAALVGRQGAVEIAAAASRHLNSARAVSNVIPRSAMPALLPAVITERSLRRLKRARYAPSDPALLAPDPLQIWRLAVAALLNRF